MPTRTEIVISFGEVLDCLPPGKSYTRKRYNSFDANIPPVEGNEENLAPASGLQPCRDMRTDNRHSDEPEVYSFRSNKGSNINCDETDDEISFRNINLNSDAIDGKSKSKRKTNAERFLEDNANYFQLEVLNSKTRSNKVVSGGNESDSDAEDAKGGFPTSFLDFLKSKGVEKESPGRSRHRSAESEVSDRSSRTTHGRSRSSHSRYGRSRSSARSLNGRDRSPSGDRSRTFSELEGSEVFMSDCESENSVRDSQKAEGWISEREGPTRSQRAKSKNRDRKCTEDDGEVQSTRLRASKSLARDISPSGSSAETTPRRRLRAGNNRASTSDTDGDSNLKPPKESSPCESEAEDQGSKLRNGKSRDVSPTDSEIEGLIKVSPPTTRSGNRSNGRDLSLSESEAEVPITRSRRGVSQCKSDCASETDVEVSDKIVKRDKSRNRETKVPASESDVDSLSRSRRSRSSVHDASLSESDADASLRYKRKNNRQVSPCGSDADSMCSNKSKHKRGKGGRDSDIESDTDCSKIENSRKEVESPQNKKSKVKKKRSELDKLLEAVDTSFHFETAAAERKRMSETGLGPLEIDCSDTGSEASCNISNKRKFNELDEDSKKKKFKESNNLLKTASPGASVKAECLSGDDEEYSVGGPAWDGWDALNSQLEIINEDPVEINKLHFSFEAVPVKESWYSTYQRQDRGDEIIYYPSSTGAPFQLPYEMPYVTFQPPKYGRRDTDTSRDHSKASSPVRQLGSFTKKGRKISECESTDSDDTRRGKNRSNRVGGSGSCPIAEKLGPKGASLLESNYRVSPRCHASTKSLGLTGGLPGDLDDLAEAYLMQDERELHNLLPFNPSEDNSNDSFSSGSVQSRVRSENSSDMVKLASSLDMMLQNPEELLSTPVSPVPAKVPPTRSRVSSEQLLSPKKPKKKKKQSIDGDQKGASPLDQLVADNVDPVLLDCLEEELPTVASPPLENPMEMLDTYATCTSMSVCNARYLRPNKRESITPCQKDIKPRPETKSKKLPSPSKPKRIIIYKDDLPGFSLDSDMEAEKLPVSKRGKAKALSDPTKQVDGTEVAKKSKDDKKVEKKTDNSKSLKKLTDDEPTVSDIDTVDILKSDDDDSESVDSFNSTASSRKRRRTNKTGFPSPKKKKRVDNDKSNSPKKVSDTQISADDSKPNKSESRVDKTKANPGSSSSGKITPKKSVVKQIKMDRFITNKSAKKNHTEKSKGSDTPSPVVPLVAGRRSVALKAKNYR